MTGPMTLREQLSETRMISIARAGKNGNAIQYTVTIPSHVGRAWVARYGRTIHFEVANDSITIVPAASVAPLPAWLEEAT